MKQDAITHVNNEDKTSVAFKWSPGDYAGSVIFLYVAHHDDVFRHERLLITNFLSLQRCCRSGGREILHQRQVSGHPSDGSQPMIAPVAVSEHRQSPFSFFTHLSLSMLFN